MLDKDEHPTDPGCLTDVGVEERLLNGDLLCRFVSFFLVAAHSIESSFHLLARVVLLHYDEELFFPTLLLEVDRRLVSEASK